MTANAHWPSIPYAPWRETLETLHLWTQIVGKVRLTNTPWLNHSWHAPLYVTSRGLTTTPIPHGRRTFEIDFDFIEHAALIRVDNGLSRTLALAPKSVAAFYREMMSALAELGLEVTIDPRPNEIPNAIPFHEDTQHAAHDPEAVTRFWRVLLLNDRIFKRFRTGFLGKSSPVHFFWGGFDLAVTRFSGRTAPPHPGGFPNLPDAVTREAYSHEVSSAGFWPGGGGLDYPAYFAYAYPEPARFRDAAIRPNAASWHDALSEFLLPYEAVRQSADPERTLLAFLQSTYDAAAQAGGWDRASLDCPLGEPGEPRYVAPNGLT